MSCALALGGLVEIGAATDTRGLQSSAFEIIFEEGEGSRVFDRAQGLASTANKYLAVVSVVKDGSTVVSNLRGSTLPDAGAFYIEWHRAGGVRSPADDDVVRFFEDTAAMQAWAYEELRELGKAAGRGDLLLVDAPALRDRLNAMPVLPSGRYPFTMGLHQDGKSVHGSPYVPRLLGGPAPGVSYDGINGGNTTVVGGYLRTLNKNLAQQLQRVANGINVHDGRRTQSYRDSEGCLTIHPDDWSRFWHALPSPAEWNSSGHRGTVVIKRVLSSTAHPPMSLPRAPRNLRITP